LTVFKIERAFLNEDQMPPVWQVTPGGDAGIETWLRENRPLFEARYRHGAVLPRGFEKINSTERLGRALDVLAPQLTGRPKRPAAATAASRCEPL
jgi:hypothetical protein